MNKKIFFLLMTIIFSFSGVAKEVSLKSLVNLYAKENKLTVIYQRSNLIKPNMKLESNINYSKLSDDQKWEFLNKTLSIFQLSSLKHQHVLEVFNIRDVRFKKLVSYDSSNFPYTESYIQVFHQMNFPIAKFIMRSIRPYFSRYARVVSLADDKGLIIMEKGKNLKKIIEMITIADTKSNFKRLEKRRKKDVGKSPEDKKLKERKEMPKKGGKHV